MFLLLHQRLIRDRGDKHEYNRSIINNFQINMNQNEFFELMLRLAGALSNEELSATQRIYIVKLMACDTDQEIARLLQEYDLEFPMIEDKSTIIR